MCMFTVHGLGRQSHAFLYICHKSTISVHGYTHTYICTHTHTCNVSSAWRDQMSLSDSVATAAENASRLGYKHVCVNYLHVASDDYHCISIRKWSSTHTHTHPHTRSQNRSIFFSLNSHLSFNMNLSGEGKFQILLNQKRKSQACHKQTKEGVRRHKGLKSQYS